MFEDSQGYVTLVGCKVAGFHGSAIAGNGLGWILARTAVFDVDNADFDSIHGLQSEICELRSWLGVRVVRQELVTQAAPTPCSSPPTPFPL